ncbi:uncharacterized protein LOC143301596 [Babylonia areolata]|uniref:uncharacterized protein LOC143301596 n=1 Tax=Babylonia areolata TaxID=304850 RepID=UPI003FD4A554
MGTHTAPGNVSTLQDMDSDILTLGVIWLTGGHDMANTPLLTFPSSSHPHLEFWSSERLGQLLRHYVTWLAVTSQAATRRVSCLADLRGASKDVISVVVESLEKLELGSRGTVSSLYLLKPANKARSRLLKKLLGLKPSKKHTKIPLFKVVLMKNHQELFNHIDLCHLTSEFGGTLTYDHASWVKFHETVAPCLREAERVRKRVPDLRDRVELLQDYDLSSPHPNPSPSTSTTTMGVAGIQQLLTDLTQSFQHTMSEARLQETLDLLKQTLLTLDNGAEAGPVIHDDPHHLHQHHHHQHHQHHQQQQPEQQQQGSSTTTTTTTTSTSSSTWHWVRRVHALHVQEAAERLRALYRELSEAASGLEETWRSTEDGLTVHLQIQRHRERAAEIEKRMKTHYEPLLQEHPSVGNTLSQAELYRTHFTTTLYEPSKELLSQATEILEDVQRLRERLSHVSQHAPCDVTDILGRLTVALQPFTHRLQSLQDVYVSVHIFHLLFQKALTWYRKVLKFLPEGLEARAAEASAASAITTTTTTTNAITSSSTSALAVEGEKDEEPRRGKEEAVSPLPTTTTTAAGGGGGPSSRSRSLQILQMPVEWQMAVQSFLHKHPPPREEHLVRLDTELPQQVEKGLRVQARSLALRLRLLQRLLYSRRVSAKLLTTVFRWRAEVMSSSSSTSSTPQPKSPRHGHPRTEGAQRQGSELPPPKPARLFAAGMRNAGSFSSSEGAGDSDPLHHPAQPHHPLTATGGVNDVMTGAGSTTQSPAHTPEEVAGRKKPPRVDIRITSASRDSDGSYRSDDGCCPESRTTDGAESSEQRWRSAASRQQQEVLRVAEDERFIRLTFTPPACNGSPRHSPEEDSFDSEDLAFRYPGEVQTGSESGIEVVEAEEDPWDCIIDRIKAVSDSNLPSDVKVQCMSHLLSQSAMPDPAARQGDGPGYPPTVSAPQQRGEEGVVRGMAGFDHFRQHITLPQDADVRRHRSFAIAREEDVRPPHIGRQNSALPSATHSDDPYAKGTTSGRWRRSPDLLLPNQPPERPATAVARMRHRLARSLMDLDDLDRHSGPEDPDRNLAFRPPKPERQHRRQTDSPSRLHVHGNRSESTLTGRVPRVVSFSHASRPPPQPPPPYHHHHHHHLTQFSGPDQDAPWRSRAADPLTRSYEGGLDALHLSQPRQPLPSKMITSWRSHEDGLDSLERPTFLSGRPLISRAAPSSGTTAGNSARRSAAQRQIPNVCLPEPRKNPHRWRQGIVIERHPPSSFPSPSPYPSPVKERRKSKEFLAPSFLKPFHSMYNLHTGATADFSTPLTSFLPGLRGGQGRVRDGGRVQGYCSDGPREAESDSLSEGSRLGGGRRSSLERLSDEVDQEYLSQDEVHSSLQRSQRILMEAEDTLRLRATRPPPNRGGHDVPHLTTRDPREANDDYDDDTVAPPPPREIRLPTKQYDNTTTNCSPIQAASPRDQGRHLRETQTVWSSYQPLSVRIGEDAEEGGTVNNTGDVEGGGGGGEEEGFRARPGPTRSPPSAADRGVTSRSVIMMASLAAAEGESDADVSNMSDMSNVDSDRKQESEC